MPTLPIISVNLWSVLISFANLFLLFLILKRFLYKPVKKVLEQRRREVDEQYAAAQQAQTEAEESRDAWQQKMASAEAEADAIIKDAADTAKRRGDKLVAQAKENADNIVRQAQQQAELERKNATAGMRKEIVDVSTQIAEKMLEREINEDDHRQLIGSFLDRIGDADD